jgi:glucose uptake protein
MLLPNAYWITLVVLLFSMRCWGSWANTLKKSGWRFELFYIDFSLGAVITAVLAAFTLGSMGPDISVQDNFLLSGKKQIFFAFLAGCVFNLANMLLVAAIEVAGMSVAFPIGIGLALIVGVIWNFFLAQVGNPFYLFGGCALVLVAIVLAAMAHSGMASLRRKAEKEALAAAQAALAAQEPAPAQPVRRKKSDEEPSGPGMWLGIVLSLVAGVLMGSFYPAVTVSMEGDLGLNNPYAVALLFSIGIFLTTFIYNLYFMNLPVKGLPISFFAYFTGKPGQHLLGLLGGIIWMAGAIANFVGSAATGDAKAGPAVSYALGQGATLVSVLWGLLVWKEFDGATGPIMRNVYLMIFFFLAGLAAVAVAPLF